MDGGLFIIIVILGVFAFAIWSMTANHIRWKKTPTLREYLAENPECRTQRGIRCNQCNSGSIKNWGIDGAKSSRRQFICNHCNTLLYRND